MYWECEFDVQMYMFEIKFLSRESWARKRFYRLCRALENILQKHETDGRVTVISV